MKRLITVMTLLLAMPVQAEVQTKTVEYEHDGEKLTGHLYWDDAKKGNGPGVMVIHAWWGLNDYAKTRARMLAEAGYVAFAADMYGTGKVTDKPAQAKEWMLEVTADVDGWQERAALGLEQLKKSGLVDPQRMAAIGYCFGGGTILQMAYSGTEAKAVVGYHASLPAAPESVKGKIGTKVMMFHGHGDKFVAPEVVSNFQNKLEEADADWEMVIFGGDVRHSFTNPDAAKYGIENLKYDADADAASWQRTLELFKQTL
ncbi:dienelactone hydrolase [Solemya velum gill symbiont]|uniref:Dienelactone hydrolase n=3 Tax=Solemya velum gill symbiont TaxID=2340 RepID=A0A0B0HBZ7_SOVGS|nr:dienelactone hydrolase family protein [Solemya velum gill symbiont]KHF26590.1 dienelactone hydrolase-like protein [Solemya velum gill symbiont]OOY36295.1 dienelactone hydrolase [Solemya velum gill symbiont]OOY40883.1 dienelactone hydrolase [Solemya velum gill symbiont]OOY43775.1 dienelactone hydrolase [Solemya velum gill symbiont]OOY52610.1 dienelactone hydrolase [Solemya velum gill symbiont]